MERASQLPSRLGLCTWRALLGGYPKTLSLIELRRLVMTIVLPTLRFVAVGAQPASAMHPMGGETTNADRVVEVCTKTKKIKKKVRSAKPVLVS